MAVLRACARGGVAWRGNRWRCATAPRAAARATARATAAVEAETVEAETPVPVQLPTSDESPELLKIRHTSAHVLAMAVQRLYPEAQVTIGPWIERGFYYDFDYPEGFTPQDLKKIKKEMQKIIKKNYELRREEVPRAEAKARIEALQEPYKLELLDAIPEGEPVTIYHIGEEWWDLCAGPHVASTGELDARAIELESVAGAYWRGSEENAMLQRIYGTAWESKEQLLAYKAFKEEAARRDHRTLGKALDLFSIQEQAGGGLVFWHPKGAMLRHVVETYWKETHLKRGYELLVSPHVAKLDLWKTSGHADFYADGMFRPIDVDEEQYQLKPMNCPFHIMIYKDGYYSYKDLPKRWAELGTVYRYERSGTMHGLFRVRGFTQDDAHIFCLPEQIASEIKGVLDLVEEVLSSFGFTEYEVNLSTRPEKSVGDDGIWDQAEASLKEALDMKGWEFVVDEGGGAFYGPKIDVKIKDAIGRKWQCSTIQVDFNLPERFDINYADRDNSKKRPIMIHRAIFGSLERFIGVATENYAGLFPLWMAPVQCIVLPVSDNFREYAEECVKTMVAAGVRAEVGKSESLAKLIRNAEKAKIPVMAVVGAEEQEAGALAVRTKAKGDLGMVQVQDAIGRIKAAVEARSDEF